MRARSILRATLIYGEITLEALTTILLVSALAIKKTLGRTMSMKALAYIYSVFFAASAMEVGFINLLVTVAT